jgi:hypothetical protein
MSCAPNLCIRKFVKRRKLEKKKMKKNTPRGGAGGRRGTRSLQATACHIGFRALLVNFFFFEKKSLQFSVFGLS